MRDVKRKTYCDRVAAPQQSSTCAEFCPCDKCVYEGMSYEAFGEYGPISIQLGSICQLSKNSINSFI